jgi:hypothetical protein
MDLSMKANSETAKSKVMEFTNGLMDQNIKESGWKIILMVKESIPGQMEENIRVNGRIICSTVEVFTLGLTAESTRVITKTTKKTEKVFTPGRMAKNMMVDGKIASNMEKPPSLIPKDKAREVNGKTETESSGSVPPKTIVNLTYDYEGKR